MSCIKTWQRCLASAAATLAAGAVHSVQLDLGDVDLNVGGYLRQYVSTNLSDSKDLRGDQHCA